MVRAAARSMPGGAPARPSWARARPLSVCARRCRGAHRCTARRRPRRWTRRPARPLRHAHDTREQVLPESPPSCFANFCHLRASASAHRRASGLVSVYAGNHRVVALQGAAPRPKQGQAPTARRHGGRARAPRQKATKPLLPGSSQRQPLRARAWLRPRAPGPGAAPYLRPRMTSGAR